MGIKQTCKNYFCSNKKTEFTQLITAFSIGLLFGPISKGIFYFIAFFVFYEIIIFYFTEGLDPHWRFYTRVSINSASFYGWILGRWLITNKTGLEGIQFRR